MEEERWEKERCDEKHHQCMNVCGRMGCTNRRQIWMPPQPQSGWALDRSQLRARWGAVLRAHQGGPPGAQRLVAQRCLPQPPARRCTAPARQESTKGGAGPGVGAGDVGGAGARRCGGGSVGGGGGSRVARIWGERWADGRKGLREPLDALLSPSGRPAGLSTAARATARLGLAVWRGGGARGGVGGLRSSRPYGGDTGQPANSLNPQCATSSSTKHPTKMHWLLILYLY
jgi:hypothetical protein